jgi:hypothetical protein
MSGARFSANDANDTNRPSSLIFRFCESPSPCVPSLDTLTRSIAPVCRSWTNTSIPACVSLARFVAIELKATKRPSR